MDYTLIVPIKKVDGTEIDQGILYRPRHQGYRKLQG